MQRSEMHVAGRKSFFLRLSTKGTYQWSVLGIALN